MTKKIEIGSRNWIKKMGAVLMAMRNDEAMIRRILAAETGFDESWLWRVEKGHNPPNLWVLLSYASLFNKRLVITF